MKNQGIIAALIGGLCTFLGLWLMVSPVSAGYVQKTVEQYVEITVERRLDGIEHQLSTMNVTLGKLRESVARREGRLATANPE